MSIILNELEFANTMLNSRTLGKKPFETLSSVAKYYIHNGYSRNSTRRMLDTFLLQCDPTASLPKWAETLDFALKRALKHKPIIIGEIIITKPEIKKINALVSIQARRLAFTLLCLSKYKLFINPHCDYWVGEPENEIMKMANISTSLRRQSMLYHELNEAGMIQFSKRVDNTNVRVCFAEDGDAALTITDFRNLGYQYLKHIGKPYIECDHCGLVFKDTSVSSDGTPIPGRKRKYCKECAAQVRVQKNVNRVMGSRSARVTPTA